MRYLVGIDLGGTNIKGGIVNENNEILVKSSVKTGSGRPYNEICDDICSLVEYLVGQLEITLSDVECIGIGSPGAIDSKNGRVLFAGNLAFENAPLASYVEEKLGVKTVLGNDANCAALGEYILSDSNAKSMAMVTIGTGFGFGLVLNDKVYVGETYGGGEYGHTTLVFEGEQCTCGAKGCIEAYASFTALERQANAYIEKNPESYLAYVKKTTGDIDGEKIFRAAMEGEPGAMAVADRFIVYIAQAIVNIINTFDTGIIVVGGGISKSAAYFLPRIIKYAEDNRFCTFTEVPAIVVASTGNDVALIGSARLSEHM